MKQISLLLTVIAICVTVLTAKPTTPATDKTPVFKNFGSYIKYKEIKEKQGKQAADNYLQSYNQYTDVWFDGTVSSTTNDAGPYKANIFMKNLAASGDGFYFRIPGSGNNKLILESNNYGDVVTFTQDRKVGIGTTTPNAKLDIANSGVSKDISTAYSGNLILTANTGSRSTSSGGAELEFVIPANIDGSNLWGQGRIITIPGNNNTSDATGKMILGTRRYFNKGSGIAWNYGDDIVIDGNGNVGIGTLNTNDLTYKLFVETGIRTRKIKVDQLGWPDFVFKPHYHLRTLSEVEQYIKTHQHLPDVPNEQEVTTNGIDIGETQAMLLRKIEELTLYVIELKKESEKHQKQISEQQKKIKVIEKQVKNK